MVRLTPEVMRHIYAALRETRPFNRWSLPDPKHVRFGAVRDVTYSGLCTMVDGEKPIIRINVKRNPTIGDAIATMAHEMCHIRQFAAEPARAAKHGIDDDGHGPDFIRLAKMVCKHHGFAEWSF